MSVLRWKRLGLVGAGVLFLIVTVAALLSFRQRNNPTVVFAEAVRNMGEDVRDSRVFRGEGFVEIGVPSADKQYVIVAEVRIVDEQRAYFKMNNLKKVTDELVKDRADFSGYAKLFEALVLKLENRWIEVEKKDLDSFGMAVTGQQQDCIASLRDLKFSSSEQKQLESLANDQSFLSVRGRTQKDGGEAEIHYTLNLDSPSARQTLVTMFMSDSFSEVREECESLIKEVSDTQMDVSVELWAGEKTRRFSKVRVQNGNQQQPGYYMGEFQIGESEAPAEAISINGLQTELQAIFP